MTSTDRGADDDVDDDGGRLSVDRRSVSASVPNFQAHRAWLDDPRPPVDVQPAEPDLDAASAEPSATLRRDAGVGGASAETAAGTPVDDQEHGRRRSPSSSWSAQHRGLSEAAGERRLVGEQLLLDSTALATS